MALSAAFVDVGGLRHGWVLTRMGEVDIGGSLCWQFR